MGDRQDPGLSSTARDALLGGSAQGERPWWQTSSVLVGSAGTQKFNTDESPGRAALLCFVPFLALALNLTLCPPTETSLQVSSAFLHLYSLVCTCTVLPTLPHLVLASASSELSSSLLLPPPRRHVSNLDQL